MNRQAIVLLIKHRSNSVSTTLLKMFEKFFKEKDMIPKENLLEIRYEDFIKDPLEKLEIIYQELNLPGFEEHNDVFMNFIASQSKFKVHEYYLDEHSKEKICSNWKFTIDGWGY